MMIQNLYPLPVRNGRPPLLVRKCKTAVRKFRAVIFTSANPRNTPPDNAA